MFRVSGHTAVMAHRKPDAETAGNEAWRKHDLFPTPPWASRAMFEHVLPGLYWAGIENRLYWDPCAGLGHMSAVLGEYSSRVYASDIINHPVDGGGDTSQFGIDRFDFFEPRDFVADWIITNPPFKIAEDLLGPALRRARCGVAFLARLQWLETAARYKRIFVPTPPIVAIFTERVAMCEGGYDPKGSTATAYAWFVWPKNRNGTLAGPLGPNDHLKTFLIPPGRAKALFKPSDLDLARRCVPGFVPPSQKRRTEG